MASILQAFLVLISLPSMVRAPGFVLDDESDCAVFLAQSSGIAAALERFWWFELFSYQDNPITVGKVILCLVLLIVGGWVTRWLSGILGRRVQPQVGDDNTSSIASLGFLFYLLLFALALIVLFDNRRRMPPCLGARTLVIDADHAVRTGPLRAYCGYDLRG